MRTAAGVALALAVMSAAGCSGAPDPGVSESASSAPTTSGDAHSRAVELVQTVVPDASVAQAEDMMKSACQLIGRDPTPAGIVATRTDLVDRGLGSAVVVTTIMGAAVAGECPQHLGALKGI